MARQQPGILLAVALGAAAGGPARAGIGLAIPVRPGQFPWAVLLVNVLGSLLIGALLGVMPRFGRRAAHVRAVAVTGFCGGFTTWSTFSVGIDELIARGRVWTSLGYLALSVAAGLVAVAAGWSAAIKGTSPRARGAA